MSYSFDSIRARVRNKAQVTGIKAQVLYQRYFIERFISRIAASEHKDSIVIKGGMLISAMTGIDMRSTKDLDATIIGCNLTAHDIEKIVKDIVTIDLSDNIQYQFVRTEEILTDSSYPCYRVHLRALLGTMDAKVEIDMTTGDAITPREITFGFPALLDGEIIPVLAYNLETILAEKMTAILDLGVFNTRARDFYDVYLLTTTFSDKLDNAVLKDALHNTLKRRNKYALLDNIQESVHQTLNNKDIQGHWAKYREEYSYAADIDFDKIASALLRLVEWLGHEIKSLEKPTYGKSLHEKLEHYKKIADADKTAKAKTVTKIKSQSEPDR